MRIGEPIIEVYHDRVIICGKAIKRPDSIAPSQWINFWEKKQQP